MDAYVLVIGAPNITEPILDAIFKGPFTSIREAQKFARAWRQANNVPGHENIEPTPAENEAWTNAGWTFGIFGLDTEGANAWKQ